MEQGKKASMQKKKKKQYMHYGEITMHKSDWAVVVNLELALNVG